MYDVPMSSLLDIGPALLSARRAQGLTQRELGARVGASQQQVARWEVHKYANVDLERVARVAGALGVTLTAKRADTQIAAESQAAYSAPAAIEPPSRLQFSPAELRAVCRRRAVRRLALFGSVLRDDFGPESDIDVLVEFEPSFEGKAVYRLPDELREVFGGRKIDLVEAANLSSRLRERVLAEAWDVFTTG